MTDRRSPAEPASEPERKEDLLALLRELDAEQQHEGMPLGARNRVALSIRAHEAKRRSAWRRWVPAASFAAGAALVLTVIGSQWGSARAEREVDVATVGIMPAIDAPSTLGAFAVQGSGCDVEPSASIAKLPADCRLVSSKMSVAVWEPSEVEPSARGLAVRSGKVLFDVQKVRDLREPVQVHVSHGTIEVVGTRFAVEQDEDGGHVDLLEGKIRFHEANGRIVEVFPGQRHAWGAQAEPDFDVAIEIFEDDAQPKTPVPRSRKPRPESERVAALIERVTELRAQKRYGAAISVLRKALRRKWDRRTAQVLSYELGELLRTAEDIEGACEHFDAHQKRYPNGRYASAVERVQRRLHCDND